MFGVPTVTDILRELEKPGRDPRPAFRTASFLEGVENVADLKPGMVLEGYAVPEMNGIDVIRRARALHRRLKVILMSGRSDILHAGEVAGVSVRS